MHGQASSDIATRADQRAQGCLKQVRADPGAITESVANAETILRDSCQSALKPPLRCNHDVAQPPAVQAAVEHGVGTLTGLHDLGGPAVRAAIRLGSYHHRRLS